MTLLGIDVSHWQGAVNFAAVKRAGYSFAILKATDGVLSDPTFAANRALARAAGLTVGAYHFAEGGDPNAEADNFCRTVGSLTVGELAVLDWETKAGNPPLWCKTWLDRVASKLGARPLIYMNQTTLAGFDWRPVVAGNYGLWLAKYDGNQTQPAGGAWPVVAMKQFTSSGTVNGINGQCDLDVFFGDAAALARYGKQPPPTPTPLPGDTVTPQDIQAIATAVATMVRQDTFTITEGPNKGQKIADQTALRDTYQAVAAMRAELDAIKKKLGA